MQWKIGDRVQISFDAPAYGKLALEKFNHKIGVIDAILPELQYVGVKLDEPVGKHDRVSVSHHEVKEVEVQGDEILHKKVKIEDPTSMFVGAIGTVESDSVTPTTHYCKVRFETPQRPHWIPKLRHNVGWFKRKGLSVLEDDGIEEEDDEEHYSVFDVNRDLRKQIADLQQTLTEVRTEKQEERESWKRIESERVKWVDENRRLREENKNLKSKLEVSRQLGEKFRKSLDEATKENQSLRTQVLSNPDVHAMKGRLKRSYESFDELQKQYEAMRKERNQYRDRYCRQVDLINEVSDMLEEAGSLDDQS